MKTLSILVGLIFYLHLHLVAQAFKADIMANLTEIKSIDLSDSDLSGYDLISRKIGDAKIVLLGEQTHGHGTTFIAKTKVIKYLIENNGFDVIAFESSFYELNKIWDTDMIFDEKLKKIRNELYPAWSAAEELNPLFDFLKTANLYGKKIDLAGVDCKHDLPYGQKNYVFEFTSFFLKVKIPIIESSEYQKFIPIFENLVKLKISFREDANSKPKKNDLKLFFGVLDSAQIQLDRIEKTKEIEFWIQELESLKAFARSTWLTSKLEGVARLATRDSAMAKNLFWLANNKFKNRKIIVWAASYHIAKEKQELSFKGIESKSIELMGNMINLSMPGQVYSLNFIAGGGSYGEWFKQKYYVYPINMTEGSLEREIESIPYEYAFVDLKNLQNMNAFLMAGISFYKQKVNWNKVFDGLFYIKSMKPPTYLENER